MALVNCMSAVAVSTLVPDIAVESNNVSFSANLAENITGTLYSWFKLPFGWLSPLCVVLASPVSNFLPTFHI